MASCRSDLPRIAQVCRTHARRASTYEDFFSTLLAGGGASVPPGTGRSPMSGDSRRIVGAANPRALAELRAGRAVDWSEEDGDRLLTQLLDMPIERLVDPKYGSPIYAGVPLDFSRSRCVKGPDPTTDLRRLFESTPEAAEPVRSGLL